jgi:hypothetical protein
MVFKGVAYEKTKIEARCGSQNEPILPIDSKYFQDIHEIYPQKNRKSEG